VGFCKICSKHNATKAEQDVTIAAARTSLVQQSSRSHVIQCKLVGDSEHGKDEDKVDPTKGIGMIESSSPVRLLRSWSFVSDCGLLPFFRLRTLTRQSNMTFPYVSNRLLRALSAIAWVRGFMENFNLGVPSEFEGSASSPRFQSSNAAHITPMNVAAGRRRTRVPSSKPDGREPIILLSMRLFQPPFTPII
jgi:hypothetical protein